MERIPRKERTGQLTERWKRALELEGDVSLQQSGRRQDEQHEVQ